jgi:membrane associated rhomboid family serine protease
VPEQPCAFHPDRLTAVTCTNCARPICSDDMIEAPVGYQCPVCTGRAREGAVGAASYRTRSAVQRTAYKLPLARMVAGAGATQALIAVNVAIFIAMLGTGRPDANDVLLRFGALPPILLKHEWWRLFTAMFVHVNLYHLVFNMFALMIFGPAVEGRYGRARFLALYLVAGFLGSAFSMAFTAGGIRAGASGGVFGILGAWIAFYARHRRLSAARDQLKSLFFLVGINLFIGFTMKGVDNFAHLGGLVGGVVAGSALEQWARARGGGGRLVALGGFAAVIVAGVVALSSTGRFV